MKQSYSGPVKAVILDWAGTTVDHGSLAPVRVLQQVFAKRGVPISEEEARRDMGVLKIDHIRKIIFSESVSARWSKAVKHDPTENDVEELFANFLPLPGGAWRNCFTSPAGTMLRFGLLTFTTWVTSTYRLRPSWPGY